MSDGDLLAVLVRLRAALIDATLPLEAADAPDGVRTRGAVLAELDDHLISRLVEVDAPLLLVVGGSTGAGKSTLVNSILGSTVTQAGVLRPTTRSPVLIHHPDDANVFGDDRLLPGLRRSEVPSRDPHTLQLVELDTVPRGVAIVDAPDVDSVEEGNREVAGQLLGAADLWLFVTSAARYADQVPWEHLREAGVRGTAVALVLDRTPPAVIREVGSHLARMLEARGLRDTPLFMIPETTLDADGRLPDRHAREVRDWLHAIAADDEARAAVVRASIDKGIRLLPERLDALVSALRTQERLVSLLHDEIESAYAEALVVLDPTQTRQPLETSAVQAAWSDFAGPRWSAGGVEAKVARVQTRLRAGRKGHPARDLVDSVAESLVARVLEVVTASAERGARAWADVPAGAAVLDAADEDLRSASPTLRSHAHAEVQLWLEHVRELVGGLGIERKVGAGYMSFGSAGVSALLTVATLGGAPGPDRHPALGVLGDVVGEEVATALVHRSGLDLRHRLRRLVRADRARFTAALDARGVSPHVGDRIRALTNDLVDARAASRSR